MTAMLTQTPLPISSCCCPTHMLQRRAVASLLQDAELRLSEHFVAPLLEALTSVVKQIQAAGSADVAALRQLLSTARLALRTWFSMNSPGLTPVRPPWRACPAKHANVLTASAVAEVCAAVLGSQEARALQDCLQVWGRLQSHWPLHDTCLPAKPAAQAAPACRVGL